jgi:hypothetical protein
MFFIHINVRESMLAKLVITKATDEDLGLVQNVRIRCNSKRGQWCKNIWTRKKF